MVNTPQFTEEDDVNAQSFQMSLRLVGASSGQAKQNFSWFEGKEEPNDCVSLSDSALTVSREEFVKEQQAYPSLAEMLSDILSGAKLKNV